MATPTATLRSATLDRILHDYAAVAARLPDAAVPSAQRAQALAALSQFGWPRRAMSSGATPICAPSRA